MRRIYAFCVVLLCVMVLFAAYSQANPLEIEDTKDAPCVSFELLEEGNAKILSTIPRIGGTWNMVITAVPHNGVLHTIRGTTTFNTYIAPDGYEVLTSMHVVAGLYDPQGRLVDTGDESYNISNGKITTTRFSITYANTSIYTIHSSTLITRTTPSTSAQGTYTRGGGESSGGGGCSTGAITPFAILLISPLCYLALSAKSVF